MRAARRKGSSNCSATPERKMRSQSSKRSRPWFCVYQKAMYSGSGPVRHERPRLASRMSSVLSPAQPVWPWPATAWNCSSETPGRRLMNSR